MRNATILLLALLGTNQSFAAPVSYSFSTGPNPFVGSVAGAPFLPACALCGGASGTFIYDSEAPLNPTQTNADGSLVYRGFTPTSVTGFATSLSSLSGSVAGYGFSDVSGATTVANDDFTGFLSSPNVDFLGLSFDPPPGGTAPRNLTGFDIDGYRLTSVRMLWIESVAMTSGPPLGDFLGSQDLPGAPPSFAGRLWLDFQKIDDPSINSFVFFNDLQVYPTVSAIPEPESYAMLLGGLALLGFVARRRSG